MSTDLLDDLTRQLDDAEPHLCTLDKYAAGYQPLAFLSPKAREALGDRLSRVAVNIPRLVVGSLAERLRVLGFTIDGETDEALERDWQQAGMVQGHGALHREALTLGSAYALVWADTNGNPTVTTESAHNVAVMRDPVTGDIVAAVKRWRLPRGRGQRAVVMTPESITTYATDVADSPTRGTWSQVGDAADNPLGTPPVAAFVNAERLADVHPDEWHHTTGRSEFADVMPLVDALNKLTADMLVTSESYARPRRWATGLEIVEDEDGNPIDPFAKADTTWQNEDPEGQFGQFSAADLGAYANATRIITQHISAVSALPQHYLGVIGDNPTSADAIRSAEASLVARALARQAMFTPAWGRVAALMRAIRTGEDPLSVRPMPVWDSAETRTPAQTADAVSKLVAAQILPVSEALRQLGYAPAEVERIRSAARADALNTAGLAVLPGGGNA